MVDSHKLENQPKKDKQAEQIVLGTEDNGAPVGQCLSAEELGDVAAGVCSKEEKERALEHFANCKKCYDAWVAISFAIASVERGERKTKRFLLTLKNFIYLGAAFLVAASVVVFLNMKNVQQQLLSESSSHQGESSRDGAVTTAISGSSEPVPQKLKTASVSKPGEGVTPSEPAAVQSSRRSSLPESTNIQTRTEEVQRWLVDVRNACTHINGSPTEQFLRTLSSKGSALDLSGSNGSQKVLIGKILELMNGAGDESSDEPCRAIRALLAENVD